MSQVGKRQKLALLTALMTMFALILFPTGSALAADINVDCGTQDLQVAIDAATAGDTIIVADATTCTGNFSVGKALTIRAATAAGATLDGNSVDGAPVLDITAGGDVTLQDLTVTGGLNSLGDGGGIQTNGILNLIDTTVTLNSAANGAGIWNDGTLNVTGSFVTDNTASVGGGGIQNISGGTLTVTNSEITGNEAEHAGGVLNNGAGDTGSTAVFVDSLVSGNTATGLTAGEPAGGAGIYNFGFPADTVKAQLTVTDTEVSGNTSAEGAAGIRNADAAGTVSGATITGNVATGGGGGIRTSGTMTVTDSNIAGNSATTSGGGIALDGTGATLTVTGSTVDSNAATTEGGGISVTLTATADIEQSSITRNTANAGAGFSNAGTLNIANSTVSANVAVAQGGGILTSGVLTVDHATITTNDAGAAGEGGGLRVIGDPGVTVTGTILSGNLGNAGQECSGILTSGGYNLVGSTASPCVYTGDLTDLPALSDPMLGALGFNGESTEHHALMVGSDAIDAGGACGLAVDQIGATRPDGPACDVGAIEALSPVMADDVVLVEPNGLWHIRVPGNDDYTFFYGNPGDVPLFGDWDGDGFDTPGMYRPSNGFAYLTDTLPANGGVGVAEFDFFYGIPGDQVFWGDWDGDGDDSLGISRNGKIYLANTNATVVADLEFWFGLPTDIAYGADLDGDGEDSVIVYRQSNSFAYYTNDTSMGLAPTDGELFFGIPGDEFTIGDWDRDLVDTPGVFRGSDTTVYLKNSLVTGPADASYVWGTAGWTPVAGVHGVIAK
ncbi:MAG: hypothetical protein HKM97_09540 [Acidimicrobiia bacterium]|nr:hypothetical protein [Acidimicrobiia bacterium]